VTAFAKIIFVFGMGLMLLAPLLLRRRWASPALALISSRRFKWAFWLGQGINLALALYLAVILIWLEFFWHW